MLSEHARMRSRQRGISPTLMEQVCAWGEPILQAMGRTAWCMTRRAIALARQQGVILADSVVGVCVIVAPDEVIVTVLRAAHFQRIRAHGRSQRARPTRARQKESPL